jgi:hypothetical protein
VVRERHAPPPPAEERRPAEPARPAPPAEDGGKSLFQRLSGALQKALGGETDT